MSREIQTPEHTYDSTGFGPIPCSRMKEELHNEFDPYKMAQERHNRLLEKPAPHMDDYTSGGYLIVGEQVTLEIPPIEQ